LPALGSDGGGLPALDADALLFFFWIVVFGGLAALGAAGVLAVGGALVAALDAAGVTAVFGTAFVNFIINKRQR